MPSMMPTEPKVPTFFGAKLALGRDNRRRTGVTHTECIVFSITPLAILHASDGSTLHVVNRLGLCQI